ncbi:unnamed protein product, partial [marine sediment metagenome]
IGFSGLASSIYIGRTVELFEVLTIYGFDLGTSDV